MGRKIFAPGALTAPVPPVLVTVGDMESANVLTIGWTGILSTHPPRTYISVRPSRHSHGILMRRREFVINLATAAMARKVDFAGIYTGARMDKFDRCGFTKLQSEHVAAPTIAECPISLECRVVEVIPMGTHDVFIADIVGVSCDDGILDENGRICFDRAGLLAYAHGEYFALGEKLGSFGFSAKREKSGNKSNKKVDTGADKSGEKSEFRGKGAEIVKADDATGHSRTDGGKKPFYSDIAGKRGRTRADRDGKNKATGKGKPDRDAEWQGRAPAATGGRKNGARSAGKHFAKAKQNGTHKKGAKR